MPAARVPKKLINVLRPEKLGAKETDSPTPEEFKQLWLQMDKEEQGIIKASLTLETYARLSKELGVHHTKIRNVLTRTVVMKALYVGTLLKLPSDAARQVFIKGLISDDIARTLHLEDIADIVKTDKNHLTEMVKGMTWDGDGKRAQLQLIAAYGQQVKVVETPVLAEDGSEVTPAKVAMADPGMAMNALKELNKMDHEYGDDTVATSSIEAQADRIKRLASRVAKASAKDSKMLDKITHKVADREFDAKKASGGK